MQSNKSLSIINFLPIFQRVLFLSLMCSQAVGQEDEATDGVEFIPWPTGKLQFDMQLETVKASSWCVEDIGTKSTLYVTVQIRENSLDGEIHDSSDTKMKIKTNRFSFVSNELDAKLSDDKLNIIYSGEVDDSGGTVSYKNQTLQLTNNLDIVGKMDWYWQGQSGSCTGEDTLTGRLNF